MSLFFISLVIVVKGNVVVVEVVVGGVVVGVEKIIF
jgi:hypothetical protein